jgi:hypothetical protein
LNYITEQLSSELMSPENLKFLNRIRIARIDGWILGGEDKISSTRAASQTSGLTELKKTLRPTF